MNIQEYIASLSAKPNFDRVLTIEQVVRHPDSPVVTTVDTDGLLWIDGQKDNSGNPLDKAGNILQKTLSQVLREHEGVDWLRVHFYETNPDTNTRIRRSNDIYVTGLGTSDEAVTEKDKPLEEKTLPEPPATDQFREDAMAIINVKMADGTIVGYEENIYNKEAEFAKGVAYIAGLAEDGVTEISTPVSYIIYRDKSDDVVKYRMIG